MYRESFQRQESLAKETQPFGVLLSSRIVSSTLLIFELDSMQYSIDLT